MKGREFETSDLDSGDSEKSLARRIFPNIFIGFLVLIGIVVILILISNQVQAGDYGVKVQYGTPANGIGNVTPAIDFEYKVDIINNGTSNPGEDINFTVELDADSLAAGWTVTPSGNTIIPNIQMGPGNKVTEIVTVRAPIDALYGDSAVINITVDVIGHKGEVGCLDSLQLRANVARDYGVLMTTAADIKTVDPGDEISFEIKVTNQGNLNDTFSFSATGLELGEWSEADVTLKPQEFAYVYYNITIDPDHNTNDILITLNVSSEGDASSLTYDILDITIHVNPRYEVKLGHIGGDRKGGYIGFTTLFNLTVKNEGTIKDTFDLIVDAPGGFWVSLSNYTIQVESVIEDPINSTRIVNILVGLRGNPPVLVGEYYINISATSLNDENVTEIYSFIVDVQPYYRVTLFSPTASVQIDPNGTAYFPGIQVYNNGNFRDTYRIFLTGLPPGWSSIPIPDITLDPGESAYFDLPIFPNPNTPPGVYMLNITIRSLNVPSNQRTLMLTVEYNQGYVVELPSAVDSKTVDVGETVSYLISIYNIGNGEDYIELRLTGADALWGSLFYSPSETGQTIHISIPGGGSETVYFNVTPPINYWDTGSGEIQITIEAESLDDPSGTPAFDSVLITTLVNDLYDFRVSGSGSQSGIPGETETFSLTINNDGSATDTFNLSVSQISTATGGTISYWEDANPDPFGTNPVSIAEGGQEIVDVFIDIPYPTDLFEIPPGTYFIEIEIKSLGDPSIIKTVSFTMIVKQLYAAEVVNTVTPQNVDVGGSVTYILQVKNSGNDADNISIVVEDDETIIGDQIPWTLVTYNSQEITSIFLDAGDVAWIEFTVSIPNRTDPSYPSSDFLSITFLITVSPSQPLEPGAIEEEIFITTNINPIYEFEASPITKHSGDPGDTVEFSIRIKNTGTGTDTYTPELIWGPDNWEMYQYPPQFNPNSLALGPGQTGTITMYLTIPWGNDMPLKGEYTNNVTISSDSIGDMTLPFTVEVNAIYDLELTDPASLSKAVDVGNSVSYQFKIKNTGNTQDTFVLDKNDLDVSASGGGDQSSWCYFAFALDPSTPITAVILDADQSETILFIIDVPSQGDPNFVALMNPLDMEVEVTSIGGTNIDDYFITHTTVTPIYSFEFSTTASENTKEGKPGDVIYFTLHVNNTGTGSDSYDFRITSIDESVFPGPIDPKDISNLNIGFYGSTTASFDINNDKSKALAGSYDIEITATSFNDPGVSQIIILTIEVTPLGAVELNPSSQTDKGEPGEKIDYSLQVRNMGNAQDTFELTLSGTNKDWGEILDSNGNPITEVTLNAVSVPNSFANIIVRVTIPGTGETKADQTYPITIKATSTNTENVYDEAQVSTRVEDFVELDLEYSGGGIPEKIYDPNMKSPKFSFRLTNNGNQDESHIDIQVDDIDFDWDYTPKTLPDTLDPGVSTTFSLEFTIPDDAPDGEYEMQVVVISSVDSGIESNPITIKVTVIKPDLAIYLGDISGLDNPDELKRRVGSQVTILVKVRNEGTSVAENVMVKLYEGSSVKGTTAIPSIEPHGGENITFRWKVVAEEVELKIEATPLEESNESNNGESIYLDLRPNFQFEGEEINFSDTSPNTKDKITITAYIRNNGGSAEDITVTFFYGGKAIGSDTVDIGYGDIGVASVEWEVPDRAGRTLTVEVEVEHPDAGIDEKASKSIFIEEDETEAGTFLMAGDNFWIVVCIIIGIVACLMGYLFGARGRVQPYQPQSQYPPEMSYEEEYAPWVPEEHEMQNQMLPPPPPPPPPPPE